MALSKLVIGLVAGIASVATIGGVTAAIVTSNRNTLNTVEESESKEKEDASMSENRSRNEASNTNDVNKKEMSDDDNKSSTKKPPSQPQQDRPDERVDTVNNHDEGITSMDGNKGVTTTATQKQNPGDGAITKDGSASSDSPQLEAPKLEPQVASMQPKTPAQSQTQEEQDKASDRQEEERLVVSTTPTPNSDGHEIENR